MTVEPVMLMMKVPKRRADAAGASDVDEMAQPGTEPAAEGNQKIALHRLTCFRLIRSGCCAARRQCLQGSGSRKRKGRQLDAVALEIIPTSFRGDAKASTPE